MLEQLLELYRIKQIRRSGWVMNAVTDPETVAAHSFGAAYLVMCLCPPGVDKARAVELALQHDVQEAVVGDITPLDGVTAAEKHRREAEAMQRISEKLGSPEALARFMEFEEGKTPEARLARVVDKLDMWITALFYEREGAELSEFFAQMEDTEFSTVNSLIDEIRRAREK